MVLQNVTPADSPAIQDSVTKLVAKAANDGIILTDSQKKTIAKALVDGASLSDALATVSGITPLQTTPWRNDSDLVLPAELIQDTKIINSAVYVDAHCIDNRDYSKSIYQLFNADANNSLTFSIFGSNNDNNGTPPVWDASWVVLPNAKDVVLAAQTPIGLSLTDRWRWILIRVKTPAGQATSQLNVTASKYS